MQPRRSGLDSNKAVLIRDELDCMMSDPVNGSESEIVARNNERLQVGFLIFRAVLCGRSASFHLVEYFSFSRTRVAQDDL